MTKSKLTKQSNRAEAIIRVCAEKISATEAAKELGVSRKTYYQWQRKGLEAMMEALHDGQGGRPSLKEDPRMHKLQEQNRRLQIENELLQMRLDIQKIMAEELPADTPLLAKSKGYKRSKKNA
jgi:transposase